MKVDGNKIVLLFDHVGSGLVCHGEKLTGFSVCGEDGSFVDAEAVIDGNTVIVSSSKVTKPQHVRFGWKNFMKVNFFNKEGLPASPFRTDNFELTTMNKGKK